MKSHNWKRWWIDRNIIRPTSIEADNIESALKQWKDYAEKTGYVTITQNAMRRKIAMYYDGPNGEPVQCGYVITASTDFDTGSGWSKQYIDLWVSITVLSVPVFGRAAA